MSDFTLHTLETAPEGSKPLLEKSLKGFGMIPNLHAVMAESPSTLEAYQNLTGLFSSGILSSTEQDIIWLTVNRFHKCHYCVPAHTMIARMMHKTDESIISALRDGTELADAKLEALRQFTLQVVEKRGEVSREELASFKAAGYNNQAALEVVLGVTHKVLSNYVNHLFDTPLDSAFAPFK